MYQPRHVYIWQMHTRHYAFYTEKGGLLQKNYGPMGGAQPPPPPLLALDVPLFGAVLSYKSMG